MVWGSNIRIVSKLVDLPLLDRPAINIFSIQYVEEEKLFFLYAFGFLAETNPCEKTDQQEKKKQKFNNMYPSYIYQRYPGKLTPSSSPSDTTLRNVFS